MLKLSGSILAILLTAAALQRALPARAEEPSACAGSPKRVGQCFTVHGRLRTCTGIPNATIWVIGTKRILGVADAADDVAGGILLPKWLEDEMFGSTPCSKAAFGDYTVCPLEPDRPGAMRHVCVDSVKRVRITEDQ